MRATLVIVVYDKMIIKQQRTTLMPLNCCCCECASIKEPHNPKTSENCNNVESK